MALKKLTVTNSSLQLNSKFLTTSRLFSGLEELRTTAHRPQKNGQLKRLNCTFVSKLRLYVFGHMKHLDKCVQLRIHFHRMMTHRMKKIPSDGIQTREEPFLGKCEGDISPASNTVRDVAPRDMNHRLLRLLVLMRLQSRREPARDIDAINTALTRIYGTNE